MPTNRLDFVRYYDNYFSGCYYNDYNNGFRTVC